MQNDFDRLMGANPAPEGPAAAVTTNQVTQAPAAIAEPQPNVPEQGPTPAERTLDQASRPTVGENDFDRLIQADRQFEMQSTAASFYVTRDQDPDRSAKVFNIARETGMPTDVVDRNFEELSKSREQGQVNFSRLARLNPAITALAKDPVKAAAIKDDLPALQGAEDRVNEHGLLDEAMNFVGYLVAHNAAGATKIPALAYDAFYYPANMLRALRGDPTRITSDDTFVGRQNPVTTGLEESARQYQARVPILSENIGDAFNQTVVTRADAPLPERLMDAAAQGNYTRAAQVLLAQTVANAPQLVALAGSAMLGVGELGLAGMGLQAAAETNQANLEQGVDPVRGVPDAVAHGAIVSYLDRFGVYSYFGGVSQRLTAQLGPQVARQVLQSYGGVLASAVGAEAGKMAGMSLAGDFADFATGVNKDAFAGSIKRAVETGLVGALTGFATTAPTESILRLQAARRARSARDLVSGMVSDARNKVRDRSPELYTEFLRNTVEGTPYAEAQISPAALETYFQKKGLDPVATMQGLGILEKFAEAKEQGTNLRLPTEQLVEKIASQGHDDLVDHVTFHEEDESVADLAARAESERLVREQRDQALDQAESVALNARGLTPEQARAEAGETIRQRVEQQLKDAGQDPKQAVLISRILETAGARTGVDPLDLYNQLNLSISGPKAEPILGVGQTVLQQRADDTAAISAAKETLRQIDTPEKAVALKGEERSQYLAALDTIYGDRAARAQSQGFGDTLYHGSGSTEIEQFDPSRNKDSGTFGKGVYATDDAELAAGYARDGATYAIRVRGEPVNGRETTLTQEQKDAIRGSLSERAFQQLDGNLDLEVGETPLGVLARRMFQNGRDYAENAAALKAAGIDVLENTGRETVAYDPADVRSANAAFDPRFKDSPLILAQSDAYKSGLPQPKVDTFYSKLERTIADKMPNSAPPDQVRAIVRDVKAEEKKWLGLEDFLKDKPKVSKAELLEFLRANNPEIVDITKSSDKGLQEGDTVFGVYVDGEQVAQFTNEDAARAEAKRYEDEDGNVIAQVHSGEYDGQSTVDDVDLKGENSGTQYAQYTLPGGENYREVLFTLPETKKPEPLTALPDGYKAVEYTPKLSFDDQAPQPAWAVETPDGTRMSLGHKTAEAAEATALKALNKAREIETSRAADYKSSHWDEANILAFTRLNDRVDAEGKRVLHVEEIQSDWHQEGRKKGYEGELPAGFKVEANTDPEGGTAKFKVRDAEGATQGYGDTEAEAIFMATENLRQVPDAPFRKTWHEFALKKIIRMAAEGGYDKVTWTTGEQQADRYNLAKHIDRIQYSESKRLPGHFNVIAYDLNGRDSLGGGMMYGQSVEQIEAMFGKEIAKKIEAGEGSETDSSTPNEKALSGLQLAVGGEGMKGFYDKILPDYARKFGKKYGAAVGETQLNLGVDEQAMQAENRRQQEANSFGSISAADFAKLETVHSLEISDALRDAALHQGFELFQGGEDATGPRGQISIQPHAIDIHLLEKANRSTFIHETGHFVVELMKRLSEREDAPEDLKADFATLMKYVGHEGGDITVAQHETLARSFEAYLMEGKAPSPALRQAFARFKSWLVDVYRNIRSLDVNLTDDVRGVFDRILATEEEIDAASREQNVRPLFSEPARYSLSDEQFAKYQSAFDAAKLSADDQLRGQIMDDIRKEETERWKDELEDERARAEAQTEQMPVYQALAAIQRGETVRGEKLPPETGSLKMNRKAIEALYGRDVLDSLKGKNVTARDGIHPDLVADMFGYPSAKELIDDLAQAPKRREFVESTAEAAMREKSPDLFKSPYLPDQAMRAIHNDQRAKVLRLELEYLREQNPGVDRDLIRMVSKRVLPDRQLKETVRGQVGLLKTADLKPNVYRIAERKAAAEAGDLLAKGDFDGAFEAKRRELVNHELYRAANEARDEVQKFLKFTKQLNKADEKVSKTRDLNLVNAARAALGTMGIGRSDVAPKTYLERMRSYDPDGYQNALYHIDAITNGAAENYRELPFAQLQTMADSIRALWDLSRDAKQIEVNGKRVKKESIVEDLVAQASNHGDLNAERPGMKEAVTKFDNVKLGFLSLKAALTRIEHFCRAMDMSDYTGPFAEHIWEPVQKATTAKQLKYAEMMKHYLEKVVAPHKEIFTLKPIDAPEIGYRFRNKKELLGALQHAGNLSNLSKLLRGRGWGELKEDGSLDRTRWDQLITRLQGDGTLKKADYDFVQGVWDMYESIKPEAQVAHKKMYGTYFNEVTNDPFETPFGEYKGGYAPALADPNIVNDAALRREAEAFGNHGNMMMMPTGGRGFTKSRIEEYAAPLALDLDYVPMAVDKVIRFTNVEPVVKDVAKLVFDRKFADAMNAVAPGHHENMIAWLNRAAKQSASVPSGQGRAWRAADSFFRAVRQNTGLNAMAGNVVNAFHQTTGFSVVTAMVDPHYIRDSLVTYMKNPRALSDMIHEKSPYMRARISEVGKIQGEIEDLIQNPGKIKTVAEWTQKNGYILQHYTAGFTEAVAWTGGYQKALAEGKSDLEAVNFADSVVRRTQHSLDVIDVARYETGSPLMRMFTQFTGYYNNKANLLGSKAIAQIREMGLKKSAIPLAALYTSIQLIPAIMAKAAYKAAEGKFDENDDGKYLDDALHLFFGSQVDEAIALTPLAGPYANYVIKTLNDKPSDDRFVIAPGLELLTKLGLFPSHLVRAAKGKGRPSAPIKDFLSLVGLLSGLPVAPLAKPIGYAADVASGKVKSHGALDYTRGLITGYGSRR